MTKPLLTIGIMRGLQSTATAAGAFAILAFDHRQSFVKMLDTENPDATTYSQIAAAKSQVVRFLAPYASAVLLDPVYGAPQAIASGALPKGCGLIMAVEETGYTGETTARVSSLLPGWSVKKAKRMGADAIKLLVYYHPFAGDLTERQEEFTRQVIEECKQADIAFYLEPVTYSINPKHDKKSAEFTGERPRVIAETARRLGALGPDVLKLEFPIDANYNLDEGQWAEACRAVSVASPCPWAVLSAGVGFELFARQVEVACKAGASGFIAGRAVWQEGIPMPENERNSWLVDIAARRLITLQEIADQYAAPWMDHFHLGDLEAYDDWYKTYPEE